jgi:hypothetical protein
MKYRSTQFWLAILTTILLCLTLSGCATQSEQSADKQAQEPPASIETTPAADTAKAPETAKSPETAIAPVTKPAATTEIKKKTAPASAPSTKVVPVSVPAAPPAPRKATLAEGTAITVITSSTLSTKTRKSGDAFQATLDQDVVEGNWTIAKRGALVSGVITNSDPGGRVQGVASIALQLQKLTLADGQEISITTNTYSTSAKTSKKKDATKIGIGAGIGAAIGAGVGGAAGTGATLATRGDPAEVPSETAITFKLAAPVQVIEKK